MTTSIKSAISPFAQPNPEPNANAISFLGDARVRMQAMREGVAEFLVKPFRRSGLIQQSSSRTRYVSNRQASRESVRLCYGGLL
jgi:FixJ family two-component response regulator